MKKLLLSLAAFISLSGAASSAYATEDFLILVTNHTSDTFSIDRKSEGVWSGTDTFNKTIPPKGMTVIHTYDKNGSAIANRWDFIEFGLSSGRYSRPFLIGLFNPAEFMNGNALPTSVTYPATELVVDRSPDLNDTRPSAAAYLDPKYNGVISPNLLYSFFTDMNPASENIQVTPMRSETPRRIPAINATSGYNDSAEFQVTHTIMLTIDDEGGNQTLEVRASQVNSGPGYVVKKFYLSNSWPLKSTPPTSTVTTNLLSDNSKNHAAKPTPAIAKSGLLPW